MVECWSREKKRGVNRNMFFLKLIILLCISAIAQLVFVESVLAWGPAVHTVTALRALNDACLLLPSIARIITSFPIQYLYGCLSADFFIGKTKRTKARHLHNWEGGLTLLSMASDDRESAYAYGFLSHLAADVVAHNIFIPNLIKSFPMRRQMGHLFWEIKADYLVGPGYIKTARDVLSMDHRRCDALLTLIAGKGKNGLKAKKHVFTQSVKVSDYFYATHHMLFEGKLVRWQVFHKYLTYMLELSCYLVEDLLKNSESSTCLLYDPMGRQNLRLAKKSRSFMRPYKNRRPIKRFTIRQEPLEL